MTGTIAIPSTLEAFVDHQEALIGRPLSANERAATDALFGIIDGIRNGDLDGAAALERIGFLIANNDNPRLLRFLNAARAWIELAWNCAQ